LKGKWLGWTYDAMEAQRTRVRARERERERKSHHFFASKIN
jgi:hypothetical protein